MMALEAPAPGAFRIRLAEERHEIEFRVAGRTLTLLEVAEDLLQAHDGRSLQIPAMTQSGAQQRVSEVLLLRRHFLKRQSLSLAWNEVPVETFVGLERVGGFGGLFRSQRRQEMARRGGHVVRHNPRAVRRIGPDNRTGQSADKKQDQKARHGFHAAKSMPA